MTTPRFLARWLPTFLAFPFGGLLAVTIVGSVDDPAAAFLAGAIAGAVIGSGQWLALRARGITARWIAHTTAAMAAGSALAAVLTDGGTSVASLVLTGVVTGALVGAAQGLLLGNSHAATALWSATVGLSWAAAWGITANVIVDAERGYVVFGSSGALLATLLTGLALPRLLGADTWDDVAHASTVTTATRTTIGAGR